MKIYRIDRPFIFTIFGASGDLAKVKLFPALYDLAAQKRFPQNYFIFGYARTQKTNEEFRKEVKESIAGKSKTPVKKEILDELLRHIYYFTGQYSKASSYREFAREILSLSKGKKLTNINYLAVPPETFTKISHNLAAIRPKIGEDTRLIIEKPFGNDEKSARKIFHKISMDFAEDKIYLLDHYLGKEGVQSILALRYANSILNTLLDGKLIANIQITAFEDLSVANRISYFDQVGIIKDMIQSHLMQILALLTMRLPVEKKASSIHREKFSILSALKYRGYDKAMVLGQNETYHKIKGVKENSKTPTFAAIKMFIDQQDWYKVPIYIRTGKMLSKKHSYIVIEFKNHIFQLHNKDMGSNKLVIELQPDERVHLQLYTKIGGAKTDFSDLTTTESLACFGEDCLPEHGRLLINVFQNDHSNFLTFEEIIATWKFVDKLLKCCDINKVKIHKYKDYSNGPVEQYEIAERDNFEWTKINPK